MNQKRQKEFFMGIKKAYMSHETRMPRKEPTLSSTDLAFERTVLAYERTLMAWVRTATSLISFGFTLYKFFEEVKDKNNTSTSLLTPRVAGMIMIAFGFLGLLLAQIQHSTALRKLREDYPAAQRSLSSILAILVLLFGLLLFLATLFRQ